MNWVSALFEYLFKLWPFVKLEPWEEGIKISYVPSLPYFERWRLRWYESTVEVENIGPGSHFVLLWFQEVKKESTASRVMDLLTQTVTLKDGTQVSFSVNIELEIDDVELNVTQVHTFKHSIEAAARIHLAKRMREFETFVELIAKQTWLEESLKGTLTTKAKRWGAVITAVGFTDLSKSKTFRLLGDSPAVAAVKDKEEYE